MDDWEILLLLFHGVCSPREKSLAIVSGSHVLQLGLNLAWCGISLDLFLSSFMAIGGVASP